MLGISLPSCSSLLFKVREAGRNVVVETREHRLLVWEMRAVIHQAIILLATKLNDILPRANDRAAH
jgi:hypothetical protein